MIALALSKYGTRAHETLDSMLSPTSAFGELPGATDKYMRLASELASKSLLPHA